MHTRKTKTMRESALLPAAAAVRCGALSLAAGEPRWLRYYAAFCWYNYVGLARGVAS